MCDEEVSDVGDPGAGFWEIEGWRRRVLWLRLILLVIEFAFLVCPRGDPGLAEWELEPAVDIELARVRRVLGCLLTPKVVGSAGVRCVVRVEIL